jgi:hypothetical protein
MRAGTRPLWPAFPGLSAEERTARVARTVAKSAEPEFDAAQIPAAHEAGHAVIGVLYGATIERVALASDGTWAV